MQFDHLLATYLGDFGRYQKRVYFLVCLPAVYCAVNMFCWTFTGAEIPHRCKLHPDDNDWSAVPNNSIFHLIDDTKIGRCYRWKEANNTGNDYLVPGYRERCMDGYVWDNSEIPPSALQEWELVCDREWLKAMVQSAYYLGMFFGSMTSGYLADRFGRKFVLLTASFLISLISLASSLSPNVWVFASFRFATGALEPAVWQVAFIIGIELVGPSKRLLAGQLIEYFFSIGVVCLGGLAYFVRDWKILQTVVSIPGFLFLSYYWLLPESPRWLLAVGRIEEAKQILRKAAAVSKVHLPEEALDLLKDVDEKPKKIDGGYQYSYFDLFRTPNIRRKTLILCYCWCIVTLIYYGISLNPSALGSGDFYLSFVLAGLVELMSITILVFTLNRLGRRAIQTVGFLLSGLALLLILCVSQEQELIMMGLVLLAKLSVVGAFCTIYLYTSEIFPTVIRSIALGLVSSCARLGGVASPFASIFLTDENRTTLLVMFGCSSILAALMTLMLPETTFRRLPETLEDGENFGKFYTDEIASEVFTPKQQRTLYMRYTDQRKGGVPIQEGQSEQNDF